MDKAKKQLLFVFRSLHVGGIEQSLVNLLRALDYQRVEVTLYLFACQGDLLKKIPPQVNVRQGNFWIRLLGMRMQEVKSTGNPFAVAMRAAAALWARVFGASLPFALAFLSQPKMKTCFDTAIAFGQDAPRSLYAGCNQFVLRRTAAKKKLAWVHGDYTAAGLAHAGNRRRYAQFDSIVFVSNACKEGFMRCEPALAAKAHTVQNVYPVLEIYRRAGQFVPYAPSPCVRLVTVCRLGWEKGVDRVLHTAMRLKAAGYQFHWFIIGDGKEMGKCRALQKKLQLEEEVLLLGEKENPYPYIKYADVLVLASRHEAAPMVIGEAQILGTPVLALEYASAREQIVEGVNGRILPNQEEALFRGVADLLEHPQQLADMRRNISRSGGCVDNHLALQRFYQLAL